MPAPTTRRLAPRLIALATALGALVSPALGDLVSEVQAAIRGTGLKKASFAVSIRDETGQPLVTVAGDRPMIPASNLKLVTTGAFLHAFGPEFSFRTRVAKQGDDLVVIGDGDPSFADPVLLRQMSWTAPDGTVMNGLDVDALIAIWVDAIVATGLRSVDEVIVDARIFDEVGYHPNWPKDQYKEHYCSEVWGFNFHHNLLHVWPRPRPGAAADVSRISPNAPWVVRANATTSRNGAQDRHTFWMNRPPQQNAITFNGNVKYPATDPVSVTLHDTPTFFARLFAERLRAAGVTVRGHRIATAEDPLFDGDSIAPEIRTPLATVLYRANTDSNNLAAESLLKRLGRAVSKSPGSWSNGSVAARHALAERLGNPGAANGFTIDDGSGLSRDNRVTAAGMTAWLASFDGDSLVGQAFLDSLAVGGQTGTVRRRFKEIERTGCVVQCKTGYIRGVSCLSGYVTAADGRRYSFAILGNDLVEPEAIAKAKSMQEKIVAAIAERLAARTRREALGGG